MNNSKAVAPQEKKPLLLTSEPPKLLAPPVEADVDIRAEFFALLSMALQ
ncbi:Multidrug/oligosaccharidyl-lipid/polysaccharide, partial [Globisporangium polare]